MTDFQDGRAGIDAGLVRRLVAAQFPQWADLPVTPVRVDGWDNRTYRLGDELTARLPTHQAYVAAIDKEHTWLPVLAPSLPVAIPEAVAKGSPGEGYPHPWAIRRWLDGETAGGGTVPDLVRFADQVAEFILALQGIDATGGPVAGAHSFHRGAPVEYYHDETVEALAALERHVTPEGRLLGPDGRPLPGTDSLPEFDLELAREVWETALATTWDRPPVWFHGDIAHGNLLVRDGDLAAVIDFGTSGVGDPACDLVIAWTYFAGPSREQFRKSVAQDEATWARARGWALWKALIVLARDITDNPQGAAVNQHVISEVLTDHVG